MALSDASVFSENFVADSTEEQGTGGGLYRVWASDNQVYGPVTLSVLLEWIQDHRVFGDTWIFVEGVRRWCVAEDIAELKHSLPEGDATVFLHRQSLEADGVDPYELRVFPVFAALANRDLACFIRVSELISAEAGEFVLRRREPGDAIFFVLAGVVRARIMVGREEKVLAHIPAGQFFGEMAMFTNTPRAADVVAEEQCRLLRLSTESFRKLIEENPAAAAPILYNISATMAQRIIDTNQKFQNEIASGFVWR